MKRETCKVLVIGAGPGGYVCAIRAGQLGLDTIVVEEKTPGGTCLNVGCIPSKALIHAATEFHAASQFAGPNVLGITGSAPQIDLSKTVAWKDGIVTRLTGGVASLLKKAKVRTLSGRATIVDGKTVDVATAEGTIRVATENLVIATGSRPLEVPTPSLRRQHPVLDRDSVAGPRARAPGDRRGRLHRAGDRDRDGQAGRQRDRGRGRAAHPAAI